MNTRYFDLINQTFYFPQEEFSLNKDNLLFHNIDLMKLVEQYGTPLKFTYLPAISNNINRAKTWFNKSMEKLGYEGNYYYCYCTKSSHFKFVMDEAFKNNIHIETSSAYEIGRAHVLNPVTCTPRLQTVTPHHIHIPYTTLFRSLKFTYLPAISNIINRAKTWFNKSMEKLGYEGNYYYCYCTKSSHFKFVMDEAFKNNIHIETSSAY